MNIVQTIAAELSLSAKSVESALRLFEEGATIPFISRYRKEVTGGLDEVALFAIFQRNESLQELLKRKETVIKTIEEAGQMTPELRSKIDEADNINRLEDIYLPYRPKKRTRASVARECGLEPLAKMIMAQRDDDIVRMARRFLSPGVPDVDAAVAGASDIIAEWVSESQASREMVRRFFAKSAEIKVSVVKSHSDDKHYLDYHNYAGQLRNCPSHRYLAIRRGEKEGILKVSLDIDTEKATERLEHIFVKNKRGEAGACVSRAVADGYKRLLLPSIETEQATETKLQADKKAIQIFADNLRQLLMSPPLPRRRVMGIDPGYRTGCKVVCLDSQGALLHHSVIYPTPPRSEYERSANHIKSLIERYGIEEIAVGNGTASRETEQFLHSLNLGKMPGIHVVNEAGASVYSASEIARREFPDEDVTVRGAVSIARRLLDPMAELVKIEPKSIGVGQYQHDVDQKMLKESLDYVVESCVNSVGVNLNTASPELLSYVSGVGPKMAEAIVTYRNANGAFPDRKSLLKVPRLGEKTFVQAAGFLRVPESANPLDNTAVHPERYALVEKMARDAKCSMSEFIASAQKRKDVDLSKYVGDGIGLPTLTDIMKELEKPGRDPRGEAMNVAFDERVNDISDLRVGMKLPGVVNNITAFGAFVDIGVHQSGLVHISELCDHYVAHPGDAVKLGQIVNVVVIDVDMARNRIALSLKQAR